MTARFSHHVDLPGTVEKVFEVLADSGLLVERYEASGSQHVAVVESRTQGDELVLVYRRVEAAGLPAPIARLVRGAAQVTQTDRWSPPAPDGSRTGRWSVVTKGVAVDIGGTMVLTPRGDGTRLTEGGAVTARVPIVGALIERLAVEQSGTKLTREWEWLATRMGRIGA